MTHKNRHNSLNSLLETMQALRAPKGCPWDVEQTPESLAPYILEEACELIDAIEDGTPELILDELGDLLLQVVFQAQIFKERDQFDFHDIADGITEKLVRRHPHVFSRPHNFQQPEDLQQTGSVVQTTDLDKQWDEIKRSEATHNKTCLADHLPSHLPALQRAQKLISRTYRVGRQNELPEDQSKLLRSLNNSVDNTEPAVNNEKNEEALGQALFELVKFAHDNNLDAETALRKTTRKAIKHLDQN
jgi:MazG family protein